MLKDETESGREVPVHLNQKQKLEWVLKMERSKESSYGYCVGKIDKEKHACHVKTGKKPSMSHTIMD